MKTLIEHIIMVLAFSLTLKAVPVFEEVPKLPDYATTSQLPIFYIDGKLYATSQLDYRVYNESLNKWEKFSDLRGFYLAKDKNSTFYISDNYSCVHTSEDNGKNWYCNQNLPWGYLISNETNSFIFTDSLFKIINKDSIVNLTLPVNLTNYRYYNLDANGKNNLSLTCTKEIKNNYFKYSYFSSDNGQNWINLTIDSTLAFSQVFSIEDTELFQFNEKFAYKSKDNGKTWFRVFQEYTFKNNRFICLLTNNDTLFTCDQGFFKFTTKGEHKKIIIPEVEEFCKTGYCDKVWYVTLTEDSNVYASCALGVLRSKDYGDTWELINNNLNAGTINDIAFDKDTMYVASRGIHRSIDEGKTWEYLGLRNYLYNINSVAVNKKGYIYAGGHGIQRTKDKGKTWETVLTTGNLTNECEINQVFISSRDYIYTTGDCNRISTDDGDTWNSLPVFSQYVIGENNEGMIFSTGDHSRISIIDSTKPQGYYNVNYDDKATTLNATIESIVFSKKSKLGYAINGYQDDFLTTDNGRTWTKIKFKHDFSPGKKVVMDDYDNFYCGLEMYQYTDSTWRHLGTNRLYGEAIKISLKGRIFSFAGSKLYKSKDLLATDDVIEEPLQEDLNISIEDKILNIKQIDFRSKFKIFNILGILVYEGTLLQNTKSIDLNSLPNGAYVIEITTPNNIYRNKFLIY